MSLTFSLIQGTQSPSDKSLGCKNSFLWTDITCNHQYYPKHGFELVDKMEYPFDEIDDAPFVVYVYKKPLN
ncbi:MAG: hypothetical protein IJE42_06805 [Bacteroidaceae bacterium]|nr:hypothetical protein [Bacteroidaceae bacterium]